MKYKNSLKNLNLENKLVKEIGEIIENDFGSMMSVKGNIELINLVCNCIEDMVKYSGIVKVDKLELFWKIYTRIFGQPTTEEKVQVTSTVEYLHDAGKIKARSFVRYVVEKLIDFFSPAKRTN